MISRFSVAALAAATLYLNPIAAAGQTFTVQRHERLHDLSLEHRAAADAAGADTSRAARLAFHALGRDFALGLEPNDRLLANLASTAHAVPEQLELYRGTLDAAPGTWARVGVLHGEIHALIWDGATFYAIEPAARIDDRLALDDPDSGGSVVFSLSDVRGAFADEAVAPPRPVADPVDTIVDDLQATAAAATERRLDLGLVADAEFVARNPDAEAELLLRANYVDGIYGEQLGLQINVTEIAMSTGEPDAFSSSDPQTLLASVGALRERDPLLRTQALVHMYTGRELDGNVVGIAYLDGVCDASAGAGLTQASASASWDALITAHEIGHNLGARHDAEDGSPCESTPPGYLMSAQLSGSDEFSTCSVQHIQSTLARASCLGPAWSGDVRVTISAADTALIGDEVPVRVSVDNLGSDTSGNVVVVFRTSAPAQILSGTSDAGHECVVNGAELSCAIGMLSGGAHEDIDVELSGTDAGVASLQATAWASNDTNPANNLAVHAIQLQPAVVLALGVQPESIVLGAGDTAPVEISIRNDSTLDATAVSVEISSPFPLSDFEPAGACTRETSAVPRYRCTLQSLRSRDTRTVRGVIHAPGELQAGQPSSGLLSVSATAAEPTAAAGTNVASAVVTVYSAVVDLESTVTSAPDRVSAGATALVTVELRNAGPDTASDARLEVGFPAEIDVVGVADDRAACTLVDDNSVRCETLTLAQGEWMQVDVEIVAATAGTYSWTAAASHAGFDPDSTNDALARTIEVAAVAAAPDRPSSSAGAGSGGGGASWLLLVFAAVGLVRRRAVTRWRANAAGHSGSATPCTRAGSAERRFAAVRCSFRPARAWLPPTADPSPRASRSRAIGLLPTAAARCTRSGE